MKKIVISLLIIIFILFLWSFIDREEETTVNTNVERQDIRYSLINMPSNLLEVSNLSIREQDIISAISRGLVKKDSKGKIICDLAESYEKKDNGLEYVFKLRKDIYWSDGAKINAKDVWKFFKELIEVSNEKDIKALLNVYGVSDYKNGIGSFNENVAIHIDNDSIKFRLNEISENFVDELTKIKYRIRENLNLWRDINKNYKQIRYSGDYFIDNISEDTISIIAVKDKTKKVFFINDISKEIAMAKYYMGERDIIFSPPLSEIRRMEKDKVIKCELNTGLYLGINEQKIPINSRRLIYRDINQAIDAYEEESCEQITNSKGCYFREEINNLNLVQDRKVFINNIEAGGDIEGNIIINAKKDEKNREICEYLSEWFKKNKNYNIKYYLLNEEEFEEKLNDKYTIVLINSDDDKFYSYIEKIYKDSNSEKMNKEEFKRLENIFLLKCQIIPVCYFNENLCLSEKINKLVLDYYYNIDFAALKY